MGDYVDAGKADKARLVSKEAGIPQDIKDYAVSKGIEVRDGWWP